VRTIRRMALIVAYSAPLVALYGLSRSALANSNCFQSSGCPYTGNAQNGCQAPSPISYDEIATCNQNCNYKDGSSACGEDIVNGVVVGGCGQYEAIPPCP
jgi:hypothetical protein